MDKAASRIRLHAFGERAAFFKLNFYCFCHFFMVFRCFYMLFCNTNLQKKYVHSEVYNTHFSAFLSLQQLCL